MSEIDEIDHTNTFEVVCPHCGKQHQNSHEFADGCRYRCGSCRKHFTVAADVEVTFSTEKD